MWTEQQKLDIKGEPRVPPAYLSILDGAGRGSIKILTGSTQPVSVSLYRLLGHIRRELMEEARELIMVPPVGVRHCSY
jgi:hypothetical protein